MSRTIRTNYFFGNKVSDYGIKEGFVDYSTLAKAFEAVLNNGIMEIYPEYWELENGADYNEEDDSYLDVYQYYIISESGAELLKYWTDELVWYNEKLDMYVWGVTHFGTSWSYVLTDIKIEK